jgi:hypothetical protein
MTESEWLVCAELLPMLDYLSLAGKRSDRKWRLFACACSRRIWNMFVDERCKQAVMVAEQFADSLATGSELELAHDNANAAEVDHVMLPPEPHFTHLRFHAATFTAYRSSGQAAYSASGYSQETIDESESPAGETERAIQICMLRCIFGNPFRPVCIDPNWLTPTVINLATVAYEERALPSGELDPTRLAVLADALEEAGCQDADILGHLRSPGPHVRGCWVVDLLLGKE